jgi:hypothetical protein
MLAYVFWHWRRSDVLGPLYENRQRAFHAALAASPILGFRRSFSFAPAFAPIPTTAREVYEDWYVVEDFAALGVINRDAVSHGRIEPHAEAAALAQDGAGGVYALKHGSISSDHRYAHWFSKPTGMRYDTLLERVAPIVDEAHGAMWMRQMVLGPGREFCVQSPERLALESYSAVAIPLRKIWPAEER